MAHFYKRCLQVFSVLIKRRCTLKAINFYSATSAGMLMLIY